jgi:hypothetical protein
MGFAIIKRPVQLINGHQSKWAPVHQPITFEVERLDMSITNVKGIFSGGKLSHLRITLLNPYNINYFNFKIGDKIKVLNATQVVYTISNIINSLNSFDVKYIGGNIPSIGDFLIFLDSLYYLEMRVVYIQNNLQYKEIGALKAKTDSNGIARFNVQELLSTKTINQNDFLYNKINEGQWGEGARFNVQIRQWLYLNTSIPNTVNNYSDLVNSNVFYYTNSANQIQNEYGYNMGEYVPTYDATRTDKAKFQSVFKKPTYFPNYPFSLNFIYSDNMKNFQIYKTEETKDINGNVITTIDTNLDIAHRELGNRLMLAQNYTSNIKSLDIFISTDGVEIIKDDYFEEEYLDGTIAPPPVNNDYDDDLIKGLVG